MKCPSSCRRPDLKFKASLRRIFRELSQISEGMRDICYHDFFTDNLYLPLKYCSVLYVVVCRQRWLAVFHYRNMDQSSVGRHWRLTRVYGGIARINTMDSTRVSSVVSTCAIVTFTYCAAVIFNLRG